MSILGFLLLSVISCWVIYTTTLPTTTGSLTVRWLTRIMFTCTGLCMPVLFIVNPDRYITWYRFSPEGISYHTIFRRKKLLPYSAFPYVMHGKYFHGAYWRDYIIFSNRRLKNSELEQINHVAPSTTLIKVRYSEKTCRKLLSVLPEKYRASVAAIQRMKTAGK